jgi:hypothetical protein
MPEKLRLDVDALRVDSFVAQERSTVRGTVNGHDDVNDSTLPVCSAAAGCQTGAAACSAAVPCGSAVLTTPCCAYTVTCPPSYTCP